MQQGPASGQEPPVETMPAVSTGTAMLSPMMRVEQEFKERANIIREQMRNIQHSFLSIGFQLRWIKAHNMYRLGNYKNIYEYAENECGIKKSTCNNLICIIDNYAKRDSNGEVIEDIEECYSNYNASQLVAMIGMPKELQEKVTPEMSVRTIKQLRKDQERTASGQPKAPAEADRTDAVKDATGQPVALAEEKKPDAAKDPARQPAAPAETGKPDADKDIVQQPVAPEEAGKADAEKGTAKQLTTSMEKEKDPVQQPMVPAEEKRPSTVKDPAGQPVASAESGKTDAIKDAAERPMAPAEEGKPDAVKRTVEPPVSREKVTSTLFTCGDIHNYRRALNRIDKLVEEALSKDAAVIKIVCEQG